MSVPSRAIGSRVSGEERERIETGGEREREGKERELERGLSGVLSFGGYRELVEKFSTVLLTFLGGKCFGL